MYIYLPFILYIVIFAYMDSVNKNDKKLKPYMYRRKNY